MVIRSNRRALLIIHVVMLTGTALIGLSTIAYQAGALPPAAWMISSWLCECRACHHQIPQPKAAIAMAIGNQGRDFDFMRVF